MAGLDPAIHLAETDFRKSMDARGIRAFTPVFGGLCPRMTNEGPFVDVAEISKLDTYLKRLFGSPRIRVVPRPQRDDYAEVLLGEEPFGRIIVDDEDDERSYNFEKSITLPDSKSTKLDNETAAKPNL